MLEPQRMLQVTAAALPVASRPRAVGRWTCDLGSSAKRNMIIPVANFWSLILPIHQVSKTASTLLSWGILALVFSLQ